MKILKYIIIFFVILILGLIVLGLMNPSTYYESEVVVNKPAKECWAVMSDTSKLSGWLPGFIKTELVSGEAGAVGAVSNVYFEQNGTEMIIEETITQSITNELMEMDFATDFMDMDYSLAFKERGNQTTLTSKTTNVGNGLLAKIIVYLKKGSMITQEETNMKNLKKIIEENTTDYFPQVVDEEVIEE